MLMITEKELIQKLSFCEAVYGLNLNKCTNLLSLIHNANANSDNNIFTPQNTSH